MMTMTDDLALQETSHDDDDRQPRGYTYPAGCLNTKDAARYIGMSEGFLVAVRQQKRLDRRKLEHPLPPPYLELTPKKICYRVADLDQWLAERLRQPTSEPPTGEQRRRRQSATR